MFVEQLKQKLLVQQNYLNKNSNSNSKLQINYQQPILLPHQLYIGNTVIQNGFSSKPISSFSSKKKP